MSLKRTSLAALAVVLLGAGGATAQDTCPYTLYGVWVLKFSASAVTHDATLRLNGCAGLMHVAFYNTETQRREEITERMTVYQDAQGVRINGSSPVYRGTETAHPTYSADYLSYSIDPQGTVTFQNCDAAGRCSPVTVAAVVPATVVWLRNRCPRTISVALLYQSPEERWVRRGWWVLTEGALVQTRVATLNQYVYFYAFSSEGDWTWGGENSPESRSRIVVDDAFNQDDDASLYGANRRAANFFRVSVDLTQTTYTQSFTCTG